MKDDFQLDFLGRPILFGMTVAYPTRRGSVMKLRKGVVEDSSVESLKVRVGAGTSNCRVVYVPARRCIVIPAVAV